jgi:hypothetical protein
MRSAVRLQLFQSFDSNPTTTELDDAAPFEIVEDSGCGLASGADQTGDVVMREGDQVIVVRSFSFDNVG